ncbi:MAG: 16S rRNA (cytidine(1402)-2'-O)-methyltransferase [Chloroflexota bacterium]|nr:16S rRNA (cytidine(1402)-2'-O)-methyltransferase [Chloroflexota bacterium]
MLYLVATPIGNLGDISLRALETLRAADVIASEDTRTTGLLLNHFEIKKPQMAFHEHNEQRAGEKIIALLAEGKNVAVVSDAGTPGISDPGFTLVRRAIEERLEVTMIPGPTALIMALALSGLATHAFTWRGFPPRKPGARRRFLAVDATSPHTLIFYESPYRLLAFLEAAVEVYGDRRAAIANDLTKLFESVQRGRLTELAAALATTRLRGEYVVVIEGAPEPPATERRARRYRAEEDDGDHSEDDSARDDDEEGSDDDADE